MKICDDLNLLIKDSNNIIISSHVAPDGDNIGSMLAIGMSLQKMGKTVHMINQDPVPSDYQFLEGAQNILTSDCAGDLVNLRPDLFISVDTSSMDRFGKLLQSKIESLHCPKLNIDHHITNTKFGDYNIIDAKASATGELVFLLIQALSLPFDRVIAAALYVAISTDTGSFQYDSVTPSTHRIAASLLEAGIDAGDINVKLYQSRSPNRQKLHNMSLQTMDFYLGQSVAMIYVSLDMLEETQTKTEDTEGLIDEVRALRPVEVAVLLKEMDNGQYKVSMRSKELADVSYIASKFNGGGHKKAAGCTIKGDLTTVKEMVLRVIEDELNERRCFGS